MVKKIFVLWFLVLSSICSAGTIDPNIADNRYIEYGKDFDCIVKLQGFSDDKRPYEASGVAISDRHVLTAAHIVHNAVSCQVLLNDDKTFDSLSVAHHGSYNSDEFGYYDIALVYTDGDMGLDSYPVLYEDTNEVGKKCSISGYGFTGTFESGALMYDGKRRAGSNNISYIDRHLLICDPSKENKTNLEFLIASGDSGGGLFIDGKLAGINSCVMSTGKPRSDYNTESGHTRVSKHLDWIRSTMAKLTKKNN